MAIEEIWEEMFYLTTHSTHFNMVIWQNTIHIAREETRCRHFMAYSYPLATRTLLYALPYRQDSTYHGLCGARAGTGISWMFPPWMIDPTTQCTISGRSYHGAISRSHDDRNSQRSQLFKNCIYIMTSLLTEGHFLFNDVLTTIYLQLYDILDTNWSEM